MGFIKSAWRGEKKLWVVFWMGGVVAPIVGSFVIGLLLKLVPMLTIPAAVLFLAYLVWWFVSVWRCAFNVNTRFWGYAARGYLLLGPLLLVIAGITLGKDLLIMAQCDTQMKEEAAAAGVDAKTYIHEHVNDCLKAKGSEMRLNRVPEGATPESIKACEQIFADEARSRNLDPGAFRALHGDEFQKCVFEQMRKEAGSPTSPLIRIKLPPEIGSNPAAGPCIGQLQKHAQANGVTDVNAYIAQNNEWVIKCVQQSGGQQ